MRALYRWLLYLYPPEFRRDFGEEMNGVFAEARSVVSRAGFARRLAFATREIAGLLCGALEEQARSIAGPDFVPRRFAVITNRSRFRFPIAGIAFMVLSLGLVLVAIRNARAIAESWAGSTYTFQGRVYAYQPEQISLVHTFAFVFGLTLVCAVVACAILHALHRSGVHRLSDARTWPQQ